MIDSKRDQKLKDSMATTPQDILDERAFNARAREHLALVRACPHRLPGIRGIREGYVNIGFSLRLRTHSTNQQ